MAVFRVQTQAMREQACQLYRKYHVLQACSDDIRACWQRLQPLSPLEKQLEALQKARRKLEAQAVSLYTMARTLERIADRYEQTETRCLSQMETGSRAIQAATSAAWRVYNNPDPPRMQPMLDDAWKRFIFGTPSE